MNTGKPSVRLEIPTPLGAALANAPADAPANAPANAPADAPADAAADGAPSLPRADENEANELSYRFMFEANPNPMWIFDRETLEFLVVNDAAVEHYGYSRAEFLRLTIKDIRRPGDVPLLLEATGNRDARGIKRGLWKHCKKGGETIDVEISVHDLLFQGRPACLVLANNVTERRAAEEALRLREQQYRELYERMEAAQAVARVGSWEFELATGQLTWSAECFRIFEVDPAAPGPLFDAFSSRIHPDDRAAVHDAYTSSVGNRTRYSIDHRLRMADGSIKHVHERCETIYDSAGRALRSVGTVQDVTERKHTDEQLTSSLDLLRGVTECTSDAIFAKDLNGRYLMINSAGAKSVGSTPDAIVGRDDTSVFSAETASHIAARDRNVLDTGETITTESPGSEDGEARWYQSTRSPLRSRDGKVIGVVGISRDITARRKAEAALRHVMEGAHCILWQAIVEDSGAGALRWRIEFPSEAAAQRFLPLYLADGQSYGDAWNLARPAEDRERCDRTSNREVQANRDYQQEFRTNCKDGSLRWLSEHVRVEPMGAGRWRCHGICTDVTERKMAEEAARSVIRGVQCIIWYAFVEEQPHGFQWYIETADGEAARRFFPVYEGPNQSYTEAWARSRDPRDSPEMDARATHALRSGEPGYTQQFRCRRADGEWRWLHETVRIERLTPGRWHCVGVCTDVTEQKRAEEERDRFFTLSLDMLCTLDGQKRFLQVNPAFESVLGFTATEMRGRSLMEFVHADDVEATSRESARVVAGARALGFENRCRCKNGAYRWLVWTAVAHEGRCYAAAHDITPLKEAETALRSANEELEARVARRTAQITEVNQKLLAAKEEADTANRAKSDFLSRMSHELRTPMNAILGFGQILSRQPLTPLQQESVAYILKGGHHLLDLINEVLDIARVEAGHIELAPKQIQLGEIIREACSLVRPLAADPRIEIDDEDAWANAHGVYADRQRLLQALINLLSNAIKYNRPGGHVRVSTSAMKNARTRIAVHDTGPGLTEEEQNKLFTPFERLSAINSGVEGTGLGLMLSRQLIMAMNGSLTVESSPGHGSTFTIELPGGPADGARAPAGGSAALHQAGQPIQGATILYAGSALSIPEILEGIRRCRPGATLLPAAWGSVGLDLARQNEPDVILLDLELPDMSAAELLARLRASALTRDVPVILLGADAAALQIKPLLTAGPTYLLAAPIDLDRLLTALDDVLTPARLLPDSS